MSSSAGVSELMDAEKKASTVVAEARALFRRDARCGHLDDAATLDDFREAVEILESVAPLRIRIFGEAHPETPRVKHALATAREKLARALASAATAAGSAEEKS